MSARVLVVDDSAVTRAVVRRDLASEDVEVVEAVDGRDAVDRLEELAPAVVLCDVEMPRLDGYGVLTWLQAHPVLRDTPVVFLTSLSDADDVARALDGGAHDYLRKPFDPVELVSRIRAALRTRRLQDELRARNEELEQLVSTDTLTGLNNRRHLTEVLDRDIFRARRHHGIPLAVLLLDVDRFKQVNDTHGHAVGDEVLVAVAGRLAAATRDEDALGRWGGEEFLVVAGDTDGGGAAHLAERLRAAVGDAPIVLSSGAQLPVTISIGWATWAQEDDGDALLARADRGLYAAKAAGRNAAREGGSL